MRMKFAALAVWFVVGIVAAHAGSRSIDLNDAFVRVAQNHPNLRLVNASAAILAAEREQATQRPPWTLGAEIENALGTGDASGMGGAELTLSLASALELGGKLDARRTRAEQD